MGKKRKKTILVADEKEYLRINRAINRLEELERNGGRWIAVDRPHKNYKKYNRKRDRRIDFDGLFFILSKS